MMMDRLCLKRSLLFWSSARLLLGVTELVNLELEGLPFHPVQVAWVCIQLKDLSDGISAAPSLELRMRW